MTEIDRIGASLVSVVELEASDPDLRACVALNLHCNRLTSLVGLPSPLLTALTDLNLSSNEFTSCDLPELAFLPSLRSLDLSANRLTSLAALPFLPGVETLSVAYNLLTNVDGVEENTPNLVVLDARGNNIGERYDLFALPALLQLSELYLGGSQPNPIYTHPAEIVHVFDTCSGLLTVDGRTVDDWRAALKGHEDVAATEVQVKSSSGAHMSESNNPWGTTTSSPRTHEGAKVDFLTPRFDRIAGWFKQRMHGPPGIPSAVSTAVDDASSAPALSSGMVEEAKGVDADVPGSTTWAGLGEPPTVVPPTPPPPLPVHKPQPQQQLPSVPPSSEEDAPEKAEEGGADADADDIAPQALRPLLLQALARAARLRSAFTLLKVTIHAPTDRPLIYPCPGFTRCLLFLLCAFSRLLLLSHVPQAFEAWRTRALLQRQRDALAAAAHDDAHDLHAALVKIAHEKLDAEEAAAGVVTRLQACQEELAAAHAAQAAWAAERAERDRAHAEALAQQGAALAATHRSEVEQLRAAVAAAEGRETMVREQGRHERAAHAKKVLRHRHDPVTVHALQSHHITSRANCNCCCTCGVLRSWRHDSCRYCSWRAS